MSGLPSQIDAKRFAKILSWRGCELVSTKGGHAKWRAPNGGMIVATCEGRPVPVKRPAIVNAAVTLGITPEELVSTSRKDRRR